VLPARYRFQRNGVMKAGADEVLTAPDVFQKHVTIFGIEAV
jgi:hypothetical protein